VRRACGSAWELYQQVRHSPPAQRSASLQCRLLRHSPAAQPFRPAPTSPFATLTARATLRQPPVSPFATFTRRATVPPRPNVAFCDTHRPRNVPPASSVAWHRTSWDAAVQTCQRLPDLCLVCGRHFPVRACHLRRLAREPCLPPTLDTEAVVWHGDRARTGAETRKPANTVAATSSVGRRDPQLRRPPRHSQLHGARIAPDNRRLRRMPPAPATWYG
jgi:hypothetical protein